MLMDPSFVRSSPQAEKPLSAAQRTRLVIGASLLALCFYGVVLLSLAVVLCMIVLDTGLLLIGLRFGFAGYALAGLMAQGMLGFIILACLRRPSGPEWSIRLTPESAPRL